MLPANTQLIYRGQKDVVERYLRLLAEQGIHASMGESALRTDTKTYATAQRNLYVDPADLEAARQVIIHAEQISTESVEELSSQFCRQCLLSVAINTAIGVVWWLFSGPMDAMELLFLPGLFVTMAIVSRVGKRKQ